MIIEMNYVEYGNTPYIEIEIKKCEGNKHQQQVVYSTFHGGLTQICFTCQSIRTSAHFIHGEIA